MNNNKLTIAALIVAAFLIGGAVYHAKAPSSQIGQAQQENKTIYMNLSAKDFAQKIEEYKNDPNTIILDVRTQDEFNQGHIEGAQNLDFYSPLFANELNSLDKNKRYFIYCRSGNRSGQTMQLMKQLGFKEVYNLQYGIKDWQSNNLPLVQ